MGRRLEQNKECIQTHISLWNWQIPKTYLSFKIPINHDSVWTDLGCRVQLEPWDLLLCSRNLWYRADSQPHWFDLALVRKNQMDTILALLSPQLQRERSHSCIQPFIVVTSTCLFWAVGNEGLYQDTLGRKCGGSLRRSTVYQQANTNRHKMTHTDAHG